MTIINPLPNTFTNGTTADATQVNANFNQVVTNVNANGAHNGVNSDITELTACTQITSLTTPLSPAQGGTGVAAGGSTGLFGVSSGTGAVETFTSGAPLVGGGAGALPTTGLSHVANSLASDVSLTNIATYFDGPSCAQGTTGTWLATGQVTCVDTAGAANFYAKLWDGTTVFDSAFASSAGINTAVVISLSGIIVSPAANIKISVVDISSTSGVIRHNATSNGFDSTLSVVRIG